MNSISYKRKTISTLFCLLIMSSVPTAQVFATNRHRVDLAKKFSSIITLGQLASAAANKFRKHYKNSRDKLERVMAYVSGFTAISFMIAQCSYCAKLVASEMKNFIKDIKNL